MFIALEVSIEAIRLVTPLADRIATRSASIAGEYAPAWAAFDRVLALTWPLTKR
ncbi:MAG TPA: hypothetical protein VL463_32440 [Kofleriaceae bacterium]|nr:hypothetical protein [Kofleriaceae bacterium]